MAGLRRKKGGKAGFENPYCGPSMDAGIFYDVTMCAQGLRRKFYNVIRDWGI